MMETLQMREIPVCRTLKRWSCILQDKRVEWSGPNRISVLRMLRQEDGECETHSQNNSMTSNNGWVTVWKEVPEL